MSATAPMIELKGLQKVYSPGTPAEVVALRGVDLVVPRGEFLAIMGASGSGKSTMMNLIGCLDQPSAGVAGILGHELAGCISSSAGQQAPAQ